MLPQQQPPRLEGGQRKELAKNLFQITHETDISFTFVIQNTNTDKEFTINYDFSGSENLMLVPMYSVKSLDFPLNTQSIV